MSNSSIWAIYRMLSGATTPCQSGPWNTGNEVVYRIPQTPALQAILHLIVKCHIYDPSLWALCSLERCTQCILQHQQTGLNSTTNFYLCENICEPDMSEWFSLQLQILKIYSLQCIIVYFYITLIWIHLNYYIYMVLFDSFVNKNAQNYAFLNWKYDNVYIIEDSKLKFEDNKNDNFPYFITSTIKKWYILSRNKTYFI